VEVRVQRTSRTTASVSIQWDFTAHLHALRCLYRTSDVVRVRLPFLSRRIRTRLADRLHPQTAHTGAKVTPTKTEGQGSTEQSAYGGDHHPVLQPPPDADCSGVQVENLDRGRDTARTGLNTRSARGHILPVFAHQSDGSRLHCVLVCTISNMRLLENIFRCSYVSR
jgi:hypothetical protein